MDNKDDVPQFIGHIGILLGLIGFLLTVIWGVGNICSAISNDPIPQDINYRISTDYKHSENYIYYVTNYTQHREGDVNILSFDGYYSKVDDCVFFDKYHWQYNDDARTLKYFEGDIFRIKWE